MTIPHLQAERLSRTDGVIASHLDLWAVILSGDGAELRLDGRLEEAVWQHAAVLGSFVTVWDGDPAWADTQVRVFHDEQSLFFGIRCAAPPGAAPPPADRGC